MLAPLYHVVTLSESIEIRHLEGRTGFMAEPPSFNTTDRSTIRSVSVRGLFGRFDYDIPALPEQRREAPQLMILYGDNGSGKTTIMRLIVGLLSLSKNKGHRSLLARTPFREFAVRLSDSTELMAFREGPTDIGSYSVRISHPTGAAPLFQFKADEENSIKIARDPDASEEYDAYLRELHALRLSVYYLAADRNVQAQHLDAEFVDEEDLVDFVTVKGTIRQYIDTRRKADDPNTRLERSVMRMTAWFREHTFAGSNTGNQSANSIYTALIRQLANRSHQRDDQDAIASAIRSIDELGKRSTEFAKFGLAPALRLDEMRQSLSQLGVGEQRIAVDVIEPYLESLQARFEALQRIKDVAEAFISSINGLYRGKQARFDVNDGLKITGSDENEIPLSNLSSGEQQVLLLLCNTILARDQSSVFLIDEPELSLNVKWQRSLVDVLLRCAEGSSVQFILATHSIELLTSHREAVAKLEPRY